MTHAPDSLVVSHGCGASAVDRLYARPMAVIPPFRFNAPVAAVFDDMVRRSVPGYEDLIALAAGHAAALAPGPRVIYDVGASLATAALAMARVRRCPGTRVLAIDRAPAMVAAARRRVAADAPRVPCAQVVVIEGDIRALALEPADLIVVYFTLQFVPRADRTRVMAHLASALRPGGRLLLAEKVVREDAAAQARVRRQYQDFKRRQGYSLLEIDQKHRALAGVLEPDTPETHEDRLARVGLPKVARCFDRLGFMAWEATTGASQ